MSVEPVCVERRRHERREFERPCKLLHSPTLRYMAAKTRDLSPGGALLEISHHRQLGIGDRIDVLVDWGSRGLVNGRAMIPATVVRVGRQEGLRQQIGIAFDPEVAVTLAA